MNASLFTAYLAPHADRQSSSAMAFEAIRPCLAGASRRKGGTNL